MKRIVDLRELSFDAWLRAIFDHPPVRPLESLDFTWREGMEVVIVEDPDPHEDETPWYLNDDLEIISDPGRQIEFLLRMCQEPSVLLASFTPDQIDQGLRFVFGGGGDEHFCEYLWDPVAPWDLRARCIAAFPNLWPGLFEQANVGAMAHMFWDCVTHDYRLGDRDPEGDVEDRRVHGAMFDALKHQLTSQIPETQGAALHGLGHLDHPAGHALIRTFLAGSDIEADVRSYAEAVLEGEVL